MATLDVDGVLAYSFDNDVIITKNGKNYALPANTIWVSRWDETVLTVNDGSIGVVAACMTKISLYKDPERPALSGWVNTSAFSPDEFRSVA